MIRVRKQDGSATSVALDEAVEVLGDDGHLAVVVLTKRKGSIQILTPGDPLFNGYCRAQGLRASKVVVHEPFAGKPMGSF